MSRVSDPVLIGAYVLGLAVCLSLAGGLTCGDAHAQSAKGPMPPFKGLVLAAPMIKKSDSVLAPSRAPLQPFWIAGNSYASYFGRTADAAPFAQDGHNTVGAVDTGQIIDLDALEPAAGLDEGPLSVPMSPRLRLQGGYNRLSADDLDAPGITDYSGHEFRLGFSYKLK